MKDGTWSPPQAARVVSCGAAKTALETPPLCDHVDKSWRAHIEAMASLHFAEAEVAACAGLADDEDGVGAKIARLQRASQVLGVGAKFVKSTHGVSVGLVTTLMTLKDTVDRDLAQATRENEVVYMVRVPAYEDLPELGAAAMVKATPPAPAALDASGESLFSNIVPESGFKALSKYTELVDTTIREEIDVLALASDEARAALAEMELPELLIAAEAAAGSGIPGGARNAAAGAGAGLPTPLAEELAAAQRGGVGALLAAAHDPLGLFGRRTDGFRRGFGGRGVSRRVRRRQVDAPGERGAYFEPSREDLHVPGKPGAVVSQRRVPSRACR